MSTGPPATPKPGFLQSLPADRQVHLDVREDIRRGKEPFARIMATVKGLEPDQVFVLRAPFEPIPLYDALGKRGFAYWTEARAGEDWSVWFWRPGQLDQSDAAAEGGPPDPAPEPLHAARAAGAPLVVDVRGLEPPLPMVRILELLDQLAPGQRLIVTHERRPMFLYPQLEHRGLRHQTEELGPGEFRITIWHEGATA
ncbi:MAG: DUF2249 domain-containing protein [Candidatus Rokubacteria bacterium]|nr:DUF2249 domain-containing protein [Candidatus Rokubacteria bacterium]